MTGEGRRPDKVPLRDGAEQAPAKQRAGEAITRPPVPLPVRVWITARQTGEFEADGFAHEWTRRQVSVSYDDPHGREGRAWVWSSAVTRR